MKTRGRALIVATICMTATLAVGLWQGSWTVPPPMDSSCGNGEPVSFPQWLAHAVRDEPRHFWRYRRREFLDNSPALVIAAVVGTMAYLIARPRNRPVEAADYVDGPTGAIQDGRAD